MFLYCRYGQLNTTRWDQELFLCRTIKLFLSTMSLSEKNNKTYATEMTIKYSEQPQTDKCVTLTAHFRKIFDFANSVDPDEEAILGL